MPSSILVVSNFFPPHAVGGAEIVAFRQARALADRGHRVTVLAGAEASKETPPGQLGFDRHEGLPVYRLPMRPRRPDFNFWWPAAARFVRSLIGTHDVEAVHIHNVMGLGANLIPSAKAAGARCIVTLHDHWGFCFRATRLRPDGAVCMDSEECAGCKPTVSPTESAVPMRLRRDYVLWCLAQADHLVTPSAYLAHAYADAGLPGESFRVVSNGIDLQAILDAGKTPSPAVRFLCSAYLGEHKGLRVLLEAAARLSRQPEHAGRWRLDIAGEGHLRPELERIIKDQNLSGTVRLLGRLQRQELLSLLTSVDVAVLPSIWPENEPVSLLEAIASGTAQIATRIGGNSQLVDDGRSGFLVPPDDAAALAETMTRYIADPQLASVQGRYNLARRADFDQSRSVLAIEDLLAEIPDAMPEPTGDIPLIICGSASPPPPAEALVRELHKHLPLTPGPRLVWHEWADPAIWRSARLLWLWDRQPADALVNTALRYGVPVLAPSSNWAEGLARHYSGIIPYQTYLEALSTLQVLFSHPALRQEIGIRARAASASAVALAPRAGFALPSETIV